MNSSPTLKIISYNIHKGFSSGNRRFVLDGIKSCIEPLNANLVFLQEVVGEHDRHAVRVANWPNQSQFEFLADKIWPHFAYGKNAVYTSGHHGNAILSAFPITSWSNLNISTNKFENRGLLHTVINLQTETSSSASSIDMHCFCVHLNLLQGGRNRQIEMIAKTIEREVAEDAPFILAGDFNDWRKQVTPCLAARLGAREVFLSSNGNYAKTYPARSPLLCLDRIYVRGLKIIEVRELTDFGSKQLSDHLPLYAEVILGI